MATITVIFNGYHGHNHTVTSMMNPTLPQQRLKDLGVRLPPDVAREAVQRLRNGESAYALYKGSNAILAKVTAEKLKRLAAEGALEFLLEEQIGASQARDAAEAADIAGGESPFAQYFPQPVTRRLSRSWEVRVLELVPHLPQVDWIIEHLESVGIPTEDGLRFLVEGEDLFRRLGLGQWSKGDFVRYVELHHLVTWGEENSKRTHPAPYELLRLAARAYAKGDVDSNEFLRNVGRGIMRYQVWRGKRYLDAFNEAQRPTRGARDRRKAQIMTEVEEVLEIATLREHNEKAGEVHDE